MKTFNSEFTHSYQTYSFGYCNYAEREPHDRLSDIYAQGYLPYSGSPGVKHMFYMARSARVYLPDFALTSENRRVAQKFDGTLKRKSWSSDKFRVEETFISFCLSYFAQRHGDIVMPRERLLHILDADLISYIVEYRRAQEIVAYVFEVADTAVTHFWFSFYDLQLIQQSLGMWLMVDSAREAKRTGKSYFYVGTVYGEKALYKTNFKSLEYWDGSTWVADLKKLRSLSRKDSARTYDAIDEWKAGHKLY